MGFATRFPREAEHLIMDARRPTIADLRDLQRIVFTDREAPALTLILTLPEGRPVSRCPSWWWVIGPWLAALGALAVLWTNVSSGWP